MRASTRLMKSSTRLWPAALVSLAAVVGLSGALTGCIIVSDRDHNDPPPVTNNDPPPLDTPMEVAIDTDATIDAAAGEGVGIFVEYQNGGHWRVWTTCDTKVSGQSCAFDVFATSLEGDAIFNAKGDGIEGADSVDFVENSTTLHLLADTATEIDAMTFDASPGAVVELEVYLDGYSQPQFVYWSGGDVLHTGAPTNPVDFKPTAP